MLALYPDLDVQTQIPGDQWSDIESDWTVQIDAFRAGTPLNDITDFIESFLANYTVDKPAPQLRKRIFSILFGDSKSSLFRQPSPEFIWNLVTVYGSNNVTKVCDFILSRKSVSLLLKKLQKLIIFRAATQLKQAEEFMSVILSSRQLAKQFGEDKWWIQNVKQYPELDILTNRGMAIVQLKDMFPEISLIKSSELLDKYISVEDVTMYLLENPEQVSDKAVPHLDSIDKRKQVIYEAPQLDPTKQVTHNPKNDAPLESTEEVTLRLVERQLEEEEEAAEEELETSKLREEDPLSAKHLSKIDHTLWQAFQQDPQQFATNNRKSKQREELKRIVPWSDEQIEGWAKILQRNPQKMKIYEGKFMFRGTRAHRDDRDLLESEPQSESVSSEPSSRAESPARFNPIKISKPYGASNFSSSSSSLAKTRANAASPARKPAGNATKNAASSSSANTSGNNSGTSSPTHHSHQKKNHNRKDKHSKKMAQ